MLGGGMARKPAIDRVLREARVAVGLEQQDLARELGVAPRSWSRWEMGNALPQPGLRAKIVALFARRDPTLAARVAEALEIATPAPADAPPSIEALDAAVYLAADTLGVPAPALRPVLARFLLHLAASGIAPEDARAKLAARAP